MVCSGSLFRIVEGPAWAGYPNVSSQIVPPMRILQKSGKWRQLLHTFVSPASSQLPLGTNEMTSPGKMSQPEPPGPGNSGGHKSCLGPTSAPPPYQLHLVPSPGTQCSSLESHVAQSLTSKSFHKPFLLKKNPICLIRQQTVPLLHLRLSLSPPLFLLLITFITF